MFRFGGSAIVSCLPRKLPLDNKQHLSSDFHKPRLDISQHPSSLSSLATEKALSGLRTPEHEGLKGVAVAPLPHGVDIPAIESTRTSTTLELLGFEHLGDLSAMQVLLRPDPIRAEVANPTKVPVAGVAPIDLTSEIDVVEEPPKEVKTSSGSPQNALSLKTEKRRRAKTNAKMSQLLTARRLDDAQERLKKYLAMAAVFETSHQQQLVMRAWAAVSARSRQDAAQQRQLRRQARMYALRAMQANREHEQQLVLRSWSAVAADSRKANTHQQELDALYSSNITMEQYAPIQFGSVDSDCPLPPGLWNEEGNGLIDVETASPHQSCSCDACLGDWGCLEHAVYSSRLFLAQRDLEKKIGRGPPGLIAPEEATEPQSVHLRLVPVEEQVRVVAARQAKKKQARQKHGRP